MHFGRRFKLLIFTIFLMAGSESIAAAETPQPSDVVRSFQTELVSVMKDAESLGVKGRYDRLSRVIARSFYAPTMIRIATGPHWRTATPEQRRLLASAFQHMSVATLAALIDGYSGERFEVVGTRAGPQNTRIVETRLVTSDNDTHQLAYVAGNFGTTWRLIDVIVDGGISELRVRMSEYRKVLKDRGVDGLVGELNRKAEELMAGDTK